MASEKYTVQKPIQVKNRGSLPCTVSKTGVTANADGDYVIKAGTPLYGANLGAARLNSPTTPFTIASTGESTAATKAMGLALDDIPFEKGASTASGTIVFDAIVDVLKLDAATQALLTTSVQTTLTNIQFINGRED